MSAVWAATAMPWSATCETSSGIVRVTRKPGIDSSLSSVPPVCPSPRPESLATGVPAAATIGATTSVVLSPTPPVECLSATGRPTGERSIRSPESTIASSRSAVSRSVRPRSTTAMRNAAVWESGTSGSTIARISSAESSSPSRLRAITSTIRIRYLPLDVRLAVGSRWPRAAEETNERDEREHVGQGVQQVRRDAGHRLEPVGQAAREPEEQAGPECAVCSPLAEDPRRQGDEPAPGGHVLAERADEPDREVGAAQRRE